MTTSRKDKATNIAYYVAFVICSGIGFIVGLVDPKAMVGDSGGVVGSVFFGTLIGFVIGVPFGFFLANLYLAVDWLRHSKHAKSLGDTQAAPVLTAITDVKALIKQMSDVADGAEAELRTILDVQFDDDDRDEANAVRRRCEELLVRHFGSVSSAACIEAISGLAKLDTVVHELTNYKQQTADRVSRSQLQSDVRKSVLCEVEALVADICSERERAVRRHTGIVHQIERLLAQLK